MLPEDDPKGIDAMLTYLYLKPMSMDFVTKELENDEGTIVHVDSICKFMKLLEKIATTEDKYCLPELVRVARDEFCRLMDRGIHGVFNPESEEYTKEGQIAVLRAQIEFLYPEAEIPGLKNLRRFFAYQIRRGQAQFSRLFTAGEMSDLFKNYPLLGHDIAYAFLNSAGEGLWCKGRSKFLDLDNDGE